VVNTARQGAAFERRVIHDLTPYGYDCIRSAASKGKVDVVGIGAWSECPIDTDHHCVDGNNPTGLLFVQCKLTDPQIGPADRAALLDWSARAGATPLVASWSEHNVTGLMAVHYRRLTGPGPKQWEPWAPGEDT